VWHSIARIASARQGLVPLVEVEELMEGGLTWAQQLGSLWYEAVALLFLGLVHAARGDLGGGNELVARGQSMISDLGMRLFAAGFVGSYIWWLTDDPGLAETQLRDSYEALADAGEHGVRSTVAANLAEALYRQGRYDEADDMLAASAEAGADDDVSTQALGRSVRAKILARRGLWNEAEALAREAFALAAETELVDLQGDTLLALGEVLRLAGRPSEATAAIRQALELWEAKGNVMFAARTRALLGEVQVSSSSQ
jgi:tetratricopeptide (TPR) repeat protein